MQLILKYLYACNTYCLIKSYKINKNKVIKRTKQNNKIEVYITFTTLKVKLNKIRYNKMDLQPCPMIEVL